MLTINKLNSLHLAVFLLLLLTGGCAGLGSGVGDNFHDPLMDFSAVRTVAILPFVNLSKEPEAAERVRDTFSTMLMAEGSIYVVLPGETARGINRTGMTNSRAPSGEEIKRFVGVTQVDAVITGLVREYGPLQTGSAAVNVISLSMQMLDKESGQVVWTASTTRGGITLMDRLFGGGGEVLDKVTRRACKDLINRLYAVD